MKLCSLAAFAVMSAVLAVLAVPAEAHHSFNTFFDMSRTVAIEGVVDDPSGWSVRIPK